LQCGAGLREVRPEALGELQVCTRLAWRDSLDNGHLRSHRAASLGAGVGVFRRRGLSVGGYTEARKQAGDMALDDRHRLASEGSYPCDFLAALATNEAERLSGLIVIECETEAQLL